MNTTSITHINYSTTVYSHTNRLYKLSIPLPFLAKQGHKLPPRGEDRHTIVPITNVHHVSSVYCHTTRFLQLSLPLTTPSKHSQELAFSCEDLNTMIVTISYVHIPRAVKCCTIWLVKLSLATALLSEGAGEGKQWSRKMFVIGGGRIFLVTYIYMYMYTLCVHMPVFYVCKTHVEIFEVKICVWA